MVIVRFAHRLLGQPREVEILAAARTPTELKVDVPDAPAEWPAGLYGLTVVLRPEGEDEQTTEALERTTSALPLLLAPQITTEPMPTTAERDANRTATLELECSPEVRPEQRVSLFLGDREIFAEPHEEQTSSLTFLITDAPVGTYRLRLRVDDVDSLLVDLSKQPPVFDETQKVTIT